MVLASGIKFTWLGRELLLCLLEKCVEESLNVERWEEAGL
jgi:hypothetical protein